MNKLGLILSLLFCVATVFVAEAKAKPQWVKSVPTPKNSTYEFKVVESVGDDYEEARSQSLRHLVSMVEHDDNIAIDEGYEVESKSQRNSDGVSESTKNKVYTLHLKNDVTKTITSEKVAEYWEEFDVNGRKSYRLYALYMVQHKNQAPQFDDVKLTTKYGMRGFARSMIVPGWGQIYKGSPVKGGLILGGAVAVATGIVVTENTRADYVKKMHEQPKFAKVYNSKAADWETARNVCIGAAAALYVYNLIDAVAADGAQRAIVKKRNDNFSFTPMLSTQAAGFSMVYKF